MNKFLSVFTTGFTLLIIAKFLRFVAPPLLLPVLGIGIFVILYLIVRKSKGGDE